MRLSFLFVCAMASTAAAGPSFEILDRGDAVEVIAHDIKATSTGIRPIRSRLEVPIAPGSSIPKLLPSNEKTIKVVELDGQAKSVLSVKVGFEHDQVVALAKHAQAIQVGNDLHVILPRAVPAAGASIVLPEPTLPPELVAKAQAIAPVPTPIEPKVEAKPEPVKPAAAPVAEAKADAPKAEAPKTEPAKPLTAATQKSQASITQNMPMLLALVLAGLGCFVWMKRKKKTASEPASSIEVIAQKGLGAKAKIVWLRAGEREMVVAVTPQAVRMLGSWKKAAEEARHAYTTTRESGVFQMPTRPSTASLPEAQALAPSSPAVAGILKLRARTSAPVVNEDIATDDVDADSLWAREILAATGARR